MLTLWLRLLFSLDSSSHCLNSSHGIENNTISFLRKRNKNKQIWRTLSTCESKMERFCIRCVEFFWNLAELTITNGGIFSNLPAIYWSFGSIYIMSQWLVLRGSIISHVTNIWMAGKSHKNLMIQNTDISKKNYRENLLIIDLYGIFRLQVLHLFHRKLKCIQTWIMW